MEEVTKSQFVSNTLWNTIAIVGKKVIGLVVSTILARLIVPEAYGLLSLSAVFIASFEFLTNSINQGLIVEKDVKQVDYSTSMITNCGIATIIYAIVFFTAPIFGNVYKSDEFITVVRVLALSLFIQAPSNIVCAKATNELKLKATAIAAAVSSVLSGAIGVVMAYLEFGIWALVVHTLAYSFINTVIIFALVKFDFSIDFSLKKMKFYLVFGAHIAAANTINALNNNIATLIGGSVYSKTDIGYSSTGNSYAEIVGLYAFGSLNAMSMRTIASRNGDDDSVKRAVRRIMAMSFYIVMPIMCGLFAVADTLIPVWLSDVWIPCIPFFKCACIRFAINPFYSLCYTIIRGLGDNKMCTILTSISAVLNISASAIITLVLRKPILVVAYFSIVLLAINCVIIYFALRRKINYSLKELLLDIYKPTVFSIAMMVLVILVSKISIAPIISLILQLTVGVVSYVAISYLTKNPEFIFLKNTLLRKKEAN